MRKQSLPAAQIAAPAIQAPPGLASQWLRCLRGAETICGIRRASPESAWA
jgi:hypothetical protein